MNNVKEALDNGWGDRIFHFYTQLVDAKAVRPQDENSNEWKGIVAALEKLATSSPAPTPIPKPVITPTLKEDDTEGSTRG